MNVIIINGPNLNLLGKREPHIYGSISFHEYLQVLKDQYPQLSITYFQSNSEGEIINKIHEIGFGDYGVILNAGAYTHTSLAIADAISGVTVPFVEVHISNVFKREAIRHHSFVSPVCIGTIAGFGLDSYRLAIEALLNIK